MSFYLDNQHKLIRLKETSKLTLTFEYRYKFVDYDSTTDATSIELTNKNVSEQQILLEILEYYYDQKNPSASNLNLKQPVLNHSNLQRFSSLVNFLNDDTLEPFRHSLSDRSIFLNVKEPIAYVETYEEIAFDFDRSQNKIILPVEIHPLIIPDIVFEYRTPLLEVEFGDRTVDKKIQKTYISPQYVRIYNNDYHFFGKKYDTEKDFIKIYPPIKVPDKIKNWQFNTFKVHSFDLVYNTISIKYKQDNGDIILPFYTMNNLETKINFITENRNIETQKEKIKSYKFELVLYWRLAR